jgi:hypothetical protein
MSVSVRVCLWLNSTIQTWNYITNQDLTPNGSFDVEASDDLGRDNKGPLAELNNLDKG